MVTAMATAQQLLGPRVRELRLARGMTIQSFAAASGLSLATVNRVESGIASTTVATLEAMAAALGTTAAALIAEPAEAATG